MTTELLSSREFSLLDETGIRLRDLAMMVSCASLYSCEIHFRSGIHIADGKSLSAVTAFALMHTGSMRIETRGLDARECLWSLCKVVVRGLAAADKERKLELSTRWPSLPFIGLPALRTAAACLLGIVMISTTACAGKQPIKEQAPQAAVPTAVATAVVGESHTPVAATEHVLVRKGDSLWSIAARPAVLGDPLRWPLLFKQNRDQVVDPDLIEVSQDLSYGKPATVAETAEAIRLAEDTPPYVKHSEARRPLPLKY